LHDRRAGLRRPAVDAFLYQRPQLLQRVAEQVAPVLPLPQGVTDELARGCVFAGGDDVVHRRREFRRERDAALVDMAHGDASRSFNTWQWYDFIAPPSRTGCSPGTAIEDGE